MTLFRSHGDGVHREERPDETGTPAGRVADPGEPREQRPLQAVAGSVEVLGGLVEVEGVAGDRVDRKSTRLNSSHSCASRMPSSACKKTKHMQVVCGIDHALSALYI